MLLKYLEISRCVNAYNLSVDACGIDADMTLVVRSNQLKLPIKNSVR